MNQIPNPNSATDILDRIVHDHYTSAAEHIEPSSGFVLSVMEPVRAQASEPQPIAFPWRCVVPGIVAIACGLLALAVVAVRQLGTASASNQSLDAALQPYRALAHSLAANFTAGDTMVCWIVVAAGLSAASIAVSFRLTGSGN